MEQVTFVSWLCFASFLFLAGLIKRNSIPLRIMSIVGALFLASLGILLWSIEGFIYVSTPLTFDISLGFPPGGGSSRPGRGSLPGSGSGTTFNQTMQNEPQIFYVKSPALGAFGWVLVITAFVYLVYEGVESVKSRWWKYEV